MLMVVLLASFVVYGCAPLAVGAVGGAAGGTVESVRAKEQGEKHGAGTYAATVLSNVAYFPAKVIFAGTGAVASGAAYLGTLGNQRTTNEIWNASVRGDYLVTPAMIEGRTPVRFVGPSA